ncbi:MAG: NUDIX domain-containing protein [Phenylobacterium sp.]|uniref:NUDIX hydrolase n=1 Tax=Phenylobacterium sp. TaxID=1871053 RepID=UPI0027371AAA|nr:NUDIX domain-containing protein [Phenylobacterium sp.]MDP3173917.1 NUDIX domain-containing protein [Phenylobacterium sp.]
MPSTPQTDTSEPVTPRAAATIMLLRDEPSFEVLMVKRHHQIDFASGALVFPGGKSHAGDHDQAWRDWTIGWDDHDADQRGLRIAAIREVFEEAGILLARHSDGRSIGGEACPMEVRKAVDAGETAFLDVVRDLDAKLDLGALTVFAHWITPQWMPKRFDTWFFTAKAPDDQLAACDGHETVDAEWIAPSEAVRLALTGEKNVIFPTRMNLQLLAESADAADAVVRAGARTIVTVQPKLLEKDGSRFLVLPLDAGYGDVAEPMAAPAPAGAA